MSLQYYDINLPINRSQEISAQGRYLRYLSGTTPNISSGALSQGSGNQSIIVTSGSTGNSIVLMPGQSIRLPKEDKLPGTWRARNYKNLETITGIILAGEGDFTDDNLINVIGNGANQAIPVQTQSGLYSNTYIHLVASGTSLANVIFTPAQNANGAWVESIQFRGVMAPGSVSYEIAFVAKNAAPVSTYDGDAIFYSQMVGMADVARCSDILPVRIFVPAGKGLYWNSAVSGGVPNYATKLVVYRLL